MMSKIRKLNKVLFCSLAKVLPPNEAGNEEQVFSCNTNVFLSARQGLNFEVAYLDVFCDMKYKKRCFLCQISKDYSMKQNCKRTMNSKS